MLKKIAFFLICFLFLFSAVLQCNAASDDITLVINGKITESDVKPMIINNRTMVPVRVIMESLGASVEWNDLMRQVVVMSNGKIMIFTINSPKVYVGSTSVTLDSPPVIVNDRTLVPIRFISENLGYEVFWNDETRTVVISGSDADNSDDTKEENTNSDSNSGTDNNSAESGNSSGDVQPTLPKPTPTPDNYVKPSLTLISSNRNPDGYTIRVSFSSVVEPKVMRLSSPYRLVFDFYGVNQTCRDSNQKIDSSSLREIRWAKHDEYSRLVIETTEYVSYDIEYTQSECIIKVYAPSSDKSDEDSDYENPDNSPSESTPVSPETQTPVIHPTVNSGSPLVVIDAGHGGFDSGAVGKDEDGNIIIKEKEANFDIAQRVETRLKNYGVTVIMTRTTDTALGSTIMEDLVKRAEIANNANADLFVSIHNNAFSDPTATGTCVLYAGLPSSGDYAITGKELAQNIQTPLLNATGLSDRGIVASPQIVVLKRTIMPAALVECAFVTCPDDQKVLLDNAKLDKIADAICEGIVVSLRKMGKIK